MADSIDKEKDLAYESQIKEAILSDSLLSYEINVSKNLIEQDFYFYDEDGNYVSYPEYLGITLPCSFTDFLKKWSKKIIDDITREKMGDITYFCQKLLKMYNEGKREYVVNYWGEYKNGKRIFIDQLFILTKAKNGDIYALSIVKDYTKIKLYEENTYREELEQYAYYDPITSGYNYIKFKERLRKMGIPGYIICMDIHSFKIINSICGIQKGDEVIKSVWETIFSKIDVDKNEIAAHINADHFIIFTPQQDKEKVIRMIKNITLGLSIISMDLSIPQVQPYFGVSCWNPDKLIESSYSEANAAKHNAKYNQEYNYAFFNEEDTQRLIKEKEMTDSFEDALAKREFKIWFQPKINPITKELIGAEALVRWIKSDGSVISPGSFIALFERTNIIRTLDEYIFRNVCLQQKAWQKEGKKIVPVSVNLSRASLYYKDIVQLYKRIADETKIDKRYVPIEITESAAINNSVVTQVVNEFCKEGFVLHIDDFGSGYSSLSSLNMMHFETLKLDKSLVDYIGNYNGDRLIEHIVSMAKDLGLHVTAEGVETEAQELFLKYTGIDSIQGFFYAKPMPLDKFEKTLTNTAKTNSKNELFVAIEHIGNFKRALARSPLYMIIANLSDNLIVENTGVWNIIAESGVTSNDYDDALKHITEKMVVPEYQQAYFDYLNRQNLIKRFKGNEDTHFLTHVRVYKNNPTRMHVVTHTFKTEVNDDIWLYVSVYEADQI